MRSKRGISLDYIISTTTFTHLFNNTFK